MGPRPRPPTSRISNGCASSNDPIDGLRTYMEQNGMGDEEAFKNIDREIKGIVNESAEFAQNSPEPEPSELWTDVLVEA